ncbi:MAG: VWA domain-containing protein [Patulibacter sp.]
MSFAAPLFLLGLLLIPVAVVAYVVIERRRATSGNAFATPALMAAVLPRRAGWRRHVAPIGIVLALGALVIAIARPERTVAIPVEKATVMMVTDTSGSMRSTDVAPSRMEAAKAAAISFVDDVPPQIRIGAMGFSHKVKLLAPPTTDREPVRRAISGLEGLGSTAAGDALSAALRTLRPQGERGSQTPAAIVLLSDGESVRGSDPIPVAEEAGRLGVRIFTIALGTDDGTLTSTDDQGRTKTEPVPPDRDTLRKIAELSGGTYSDAPDAASLEAVYRDLGSEVATEPGKEQTTVFAVGAALLLLIGGVGGSLAATGRVI